MLKLFSFPFCAMGTSCILHIYAIRHRGSKIAQYAISEVLRIEARYSRYRTDRVLSKMNRAAEQGTSIEVDEETSALLDYAYSCYQKSDKMFDISSGILRKAWDFSSTCLPGNGIIDQLLPFVGLEKVIWKAPKKTLI